MYKGTQPTSSILTSLHNYCFARASTALFLFLSLNQAAEATSTVPASITTPQNTISPIRFVPSPAIAACAGKPVKLATAMIAKKVPIMTPRSLVCPPATSISAGVISDTNAPDANPKTMAKTIRPPRELR